MAEPEKTVETNTSVAPEMPQATLDAAVQKEEEQVKPNTPKAQLEKPATASPPSNLEKKSYTKDEVEKIVNDKIAELKLQIEKRDRGDAMREKGVGKEFMEFVEFAAQKLVNQQTSFDAALDKYLADNPQYLAKQKATGIDMNGTAEQFNGVEQAFYAKNPNLKK